MSHDFAKNRGDETGRWALDGLSPWGLLGVGGAVGMVGGVLLCLLLYVAGVVPPLRGGDATGTADMTGTAAARATKDASDIAVTADTGDTGDAASNASGQEATVADGGDAEDGETLELEFWTALPDYEVEVDARPLVGADGYLLQSGSFRRLELAQKEMRRQRGLGLDVRIRQGEFQGVVYHQLQSGPYTNGESLAEAERTLLRHSIPYSRLQP